MNSEVYAGIYVNARDSADGETPSRIVVTSESNGHAIWRDTHDERVLLEYRQFGSESEAIEAGVLMAIAHRKEMA